MIARVFHVNRDKFVVNQANRSQNILTLSHDRFPLLRRRTQRIDDYYPSSQRLAIGYHDKFVAQNFHNGRARAELGDQRVEVIVLLRQVLTLDDLSLLAALDNVNEEIALIFGRARVVIAQWIV